MENFCIRLIFPEKYRKVVFKIQEQAKIDCYKREHSENNKKVLKLIKYPYIVTEIEKNQYSS